MKIERLDPIDATLRPSNHPYLNGAWTPLLEEVNATELEVIEGTVPADIDGVYLRNTENQVHQPLGRLQIIARVGGHRDGDELATVGGHLKAPWAGPGQLDQAGARLAVGERLVVPEPAELQHLEPTVVVDLILGDRGLEDGRLSGGV